VGRHAPPAPAVRRAAVRRRPAPADRHAQADRASRAFDAEIARRREESGGWERRIVEDKLSHVGELPEQLEANMRGLERLAAAMAARTEPLHAEEVRRSEPSRAGWAPDPEAGRMAAAEQQAAQQLAVARQSLGREHPERLPLLLLARNGAGGLEGVLPLFEELSWAGGVPARRLAWLGEELVGSDYLDVLSLPGSEQRVGGAFGNWLAEREGGWGVL